MVDQRLFFPREEPLIHGWVHTCLWLRVYVATNRPLRSRGGRYDPGHDVWLKVGKQVSKDRRR